MSYSFRIAFKTTGKAFESEHETVAFHMSRTQQPLRLSGMAKGTAIKESDRFSIVGGPYKSEEAAAEAANAVVQALWIWCIDSGQGIDLGQHSVQGFHVSETGSEFFAKALHAERVIPDRLGVTVFKSEPTPTFFRIALKGNVSRPVESFLNALVGSIAHCRLNSKRALLAAELYGTSHFVGLMPARFVLMFAAVEALLAPSRRGAEALIHLRTLKDLTASAGLDYADAESITSGLGFLMRESIRN
jgi:hypothetical protein